MQLVPFPYIYWFPPKKTRDFAIVKTLTNDMTLKLYKAEKDTFAHILFKI